MKKTLHYGFRIYIAICATACAFFTGMTFSLTEQYRFRDDRNEEIIQELKEINYELDKQNRDLQLGRDDKGRLWTH